MEIRANVYSPLQNTAVWLGAWLYHYASTEDTIDALNDLGGPHLFHNGGILDFLKHLRGIATPLLDASPGTDYPGPLITLILSGPGQPPLLPSDTAAAQEAAKSPEGVIVLRDVDKLVHHVLIPQRSYEATTWQLLRLDGELPAQNGLLPGEADELLRQATDEAATIIQRTAFRSQTPQTLNNPRLTVGRLSDFYDTPGLPTATPSRSARLFARADRVAAIA